MNIDTSKISRVEIIDHTKDHEHGGGRAYVYWDFEDKTKVELALQNQEKTLKIFITSREEKK